MNDSPTERAKPTVFLDRDDTLNVNATLPPEAFPGTKGDLYLPEFVELIPGAADACVALRRVGYTLVVVTNQASIARGTASHDDIDATNARLMELLPDPDRPGDSLIERCYYAPHHPDAVVDAYRSGPGTQWPGDHPDRKPGPGMLLRAIDELGLDPARSWMIGDKDRDVMAGVNAGLDPARCLRVGDASILGERASDADFPSLAAAAEFILRRAHLDTASETTTREDTIEEAAFELRLVEASTVTLRDPTAEPLADPDTRETVESAARAIAERTGIELLALETTSDAVTATLATHKLAATAFMAELRRATNQWHAEHRGGLLWPEKRQD
ncbi:MAG: HAD-IIIA family hydrolase [Planctomycetota bacterium]